MGKRIQEFRNPKTLVSVSSPSQQKALAARALRDSFRNLFKTWPTRHPAAWEKLRQTTQLRRTELSHTFSPRGAAESARTGADFFCAPYALWGSVSARDLCQEPGPSLTKDMHRRECGAVTAAQSAFSSNFSSGTSFRCADLYQAAGARPLAGAVECHFPAGSGRESEPRGCLGSCPCSAGAASPIPARTFSGQASCRSSH